MDKETPLRASPTGLRKLLGSLFSDLSAKNLQVLAIFVIATLVIIAKNYFLLAAGVISSVGPFMTALIVLISGLPVQCWVYRPSLRCGWPEWRSAIFLGVSLGVNNVAALYTFRWIPPQIVAPLGFVWIAVFMLGADIVRDLRKKNYSTALWPILAVPGLWALLRDSANGGDGEQFSPGPGVFILGHEIPGWILGMAAVIITAATYAFGVKRLEAFEKDLKGKIDTLSRIPALAIMALGALLLGGGWEVMTSGNRSDLLICVGAGLVAGLCSLLVIKAYEKRLRSAAIAMLSPLMTLAGILLGMLVEMTAPGPLGWLGIVVILVASYGAAKYQSRTTTFSSD